jgi:hypothetical protein
MYLADASVANDVMQAAEATPREVCTTGFYPWDGSRHEECEKQGTPAISPFREARLINEIAGASLIAAGGGAMYFIRRKFEN